MLGALSLCRSRRASMGLSQPKTEALRNPREPAPTKSKNMSA